MSKSKWVEELKRQMAATDPAPLPSPQPIPAVVKPQVAHEVLATMFLLIAIVALGAFIYLALQYHTNKNVVPESQVQQMEQLDTAPMEQQPVKLDLRPDQGSEMLTNTVNGIVAKTKELEHRVWVLGVLNNNNFASLQQIAPNAEVVYIQSNWSVDKIPTRIRLTDEQKQILGNVPMDLQ